MSSTVTNPQNDRRTLTHRGTEVGSSNVELLQNTTGTMSPVLKWTCPRKFKRIDYAAGVHETRFVPRAMETITGSTNDDTTVSLNTNILPIAGEPLIDDQEWPVVVAYNATTGTQYDVTVSNYGANEITLGTDPADGDTVKLYPVIGDGVVQYRGIDQFSHEVGSLDNWGTPIQDFSDHDQMKQESLIHLTGSITFRENEVWSLYMDSPSQLVWQDADYPEGDYVSTIEQKVDVSV